MKDYLEQYNLKKIIQEALGVNFSDLKDIEKKIDSNLLATISLENISQDYFDLILSSKKIIESEIIDDVKYYFFYYKNIFFKVELESSSMKLASINFSSSSAFSNYSKDDFDKFKNDSKKFISSQSFSFDDVKHTDSKDFWKYIILCLKLYIKKYNVNTFSFSGSSSSQAKNVKTKKTTLLLIKKQIESFPSLLYSNLQNFNKQKNNLLKDEIITKIEKYKNEIILDVSKQNIQTIEKYNIEDILQDVIDAINETLKLNSKNEQNLKKILLLIYDLLDSTNNDMNDIKKRINSLLNNTNLKRQKKIFDIYINEFNKFYKQFANVLSILELKSEFDSLYDKQNTIKLLGRKLIVIEEFYSFLLSYRLYLTLQTLNLKSDKINSLSFIKKLISIIGEFIKKYDFISITVFKIIEYLLYSFKNLAKKNIEFIRFSKEEVTKAFDDTIKEIIKTEENIKLAENYDIKLKQFINKNFEIEPIYLNHIEDLEYSSLNFFKSFFSNNNEDVGQISYLLQFSKKGFESFLNNREKLYYRALQSYRKSNPSDIDIFYDGYVMYFKINNSNI
jgi:hypothetical protein